MLSSKTRRTSNRAASLLRLAAVSVGRTDTALGAFYRRLAARAGKAKAITATARKIAVLFYNTLRHGMSYADPGATLLRRTLQATCPRQSPTAREVAGIRFASGGAGPHPDGGFLGKLRRCWASRWRPATASLDRRSRGTRTSQRHDRRGLRRARGFTRQRAAPARAAGRTAGDCPPAAEAGAGADRSATAGGAGPVACAALRRSGAGRDLRQPAR